jgi:hypothetical protein
VGYFNFDGKLHSTSQYTTLHFDSDDVLVEKIKIAYNRINKEIRSVKADIHNIDENLKGYDYENKLMVENLPKKIKYEYYYDDKLNEYGPFFILITDNNGKTTSERYYYMHGIIIRHVANDGNLQLIDDAPFGPENEVHLQARKHLADFKSAKILSNKLNNQSVENVDKMCREIDDKISKGLYKKGDTNSAGMGEYQHSSETYLDNKKNTIYSFDHTSDECGTVESKSYYANGELIWSFDEGYEDSKGDNAGWYSNTYSETTYYSKGSSFRTIREQNGVTEISE